MCSFAFLSRKENHLFTIPGYEALNSKMEPTLMKDLASGEVMRFYFKEMTLLIWDVKVNMVELLFLELYYL